MYQYIYNIPLDTIVHHIYHYISPRKSPNSIDTFHAIRVCTESMNPKLTEELRHKLDALPDLPGVYLMRNADNRPIYIGKAKNLRSRVRSYFQEGSDDGRKQFKALVAKVVDLEYIITETEQEALILEANQIKAHRPRYNVYLKDDKKYPYIRITADPFPRIHATRDIVRDCSRYLGP